jgi:hypothetical protein
MKTDFFLNNKILMKQNFSRDFFLSFINKNVFLWIVEKKNYIYVFLNEFLAKIKFFGDGNCFFGESFWIEIKTKIQLFYILITQEIKAKNMSFNLIEFLWIYFGAFVEELYFFIEYSED